MPAAPFSRASGERQQHNGLAQCSRAFRSAAPHERRPRTPRCAATRRDALVATLFAAGTGAAVALRSPAAAEGGLRDMTPGEAAAMQAALEKAVNKAKAPLFLRLLFHDAGTYSIADRDGGPNASIQFELERAENAGLKRGWSNVAQVKAQLANTEARTLSYADIIAHLAARSVSITGGPAIPVQVGRTDATAADPPGRLPDETFDVQQLKESFASVGITPAEMVCLSGAHTIGAKGFGDPSTFDNFYFKALLNKPWLDKKNSMAEMIGLPSDKVLPDDQECRRVVERYAGDQAAWHSDFARAFTKLATLGYA